MSKAGFSVIDVSKKVASGVGATSILFSVAPHGNVGAMFGFLGSLFSKEQENKQSENNTNKRFEDQVDSSYSKIYDNSYGQKIVSLEKKKEEEENKNDPGFFDKIGNAFSSIFNKDQGNKQSENNNNKEFEDQGSSSYNKIYDNSYGQNIVSLKEKEEEKGEEKKDDPGFFGKVGNAFSSIFSSENDTKKQNNVVLVKEKEEVEKRNVPGFFEGMKERFTGIKEGIGEVADKVTDTIKSVFTSGKKEQNENNFSNEVEEQEEEDSYKNNKKRRYSDDDLVENCKIEANDDEDGELNFYKRDFNKEGEEIGKHKISNEKNVDDYNGDSFNIAPDKVIANNNTENMIIEKNDNSDNENEEENENDDDSKKENENENEFYESQNMIIEENNNNGNTNIQEQDNFSLLNQGFSTPNE